MPFLSTLYIKTYAMLNILFTRILAKTCILMKFCLNLFIHAQKSGGELNLVFVQSWRGCLCAHFGCVCVRVLQMCAWKTSHTARDCSANNPERLLCSPCVFGQSPDTWDWTRMQVLVVMHRRTLNENVDSAKIKVAFYTTDIDILRVASMHRIVIHCIDISIHIDESLHPYWLHIWFRAGYRWWRSPQRSTQLEFPKENRTLFLHVVAFAMNILLTGTSHAYY